MSIVFRSKADVLMWAPDRCGSVKVRAVTKVIQDDGWVLIRQRGSHRHFQHATKPGNVTVPGHPGDEMAPRTLGSIWRQARLKGAG